jgi:hypothetical protein
MVNTGRFHFVQPWYRLDKSNEKQLLVNENGTCVVGPGGLEPPTRPL